jgi:hypothetical protein
VHDSLEPTSNMRSTGLQRELSVAAAP